MCDENQVEAKIPIGDAEPKFMIEFLLAFPYLKKRAERGILSVGGSRAEQFSSPIGFHRQVEV